MFAISETVEKDISNRSGLSSILIYNGIHERAIKKKTSQNQIKSIRLLQISRLIHQKKGQHLAIEAIYNLKKLGINNISLDFIGEGKSFEFLNKLIQTYQFRY